jgi:hypothetical protein
MKASRVLVPLLPVLLAAASPAQAQIYRWTDANGVVHYEQVPPPGRTAEAVNPALPPPAPPAGDADEAARAFLKRSGDEAARKAAEKQAADAEKSRALAVCLSARREKQFLDERPPNRLLIRETGGETRRMDPGEWEKLQKTASDAIAENCKP